MSLNIPTQQLLSEGTKWFAYSGVTQGDVSVPATISLIDIPNTGLRDSYVCIQPFYGLEIASGAGDQLGVSVLIDNIEVINRQNFYYSSDDGELKIFVPRQSRLQILSLNTTNNNTQTRGTTVIGYYL